MTKFSNVWIKFKKKFTSKLSIRTSDQHKDVLTVFHSHLKRPFDERECPYRTKLLEEKQIKDRALVVSCTRLDHVFVVRDRPNISINLG